MRRRLALVVLLSLAGLSSGPWAAASTTPPLPGTIAAIGDSMTRAADVCCWYGDHPHQSWSTGDASWDGITSHYERILAHKAVIAGRNFNDAVSGARMSDAPRQAGVTVTQGAKYVTILMGANDVCTGTIAGMTSVGTFRAQFQQTLSVLETGLPGSAHIFVSSIPNVLHLWQLFHDNAIASFIWDEANICQSMLSTANSDADRQSVLDREVSFNGVLSEECAKYPNCRFDGLAVFHYQFSASQVSKLDFFHPSLSGQAALAQVTWGASWWSGL